MTPTTCSVHAACLCAAVACTATQAQVVAGKDRFGDVTRFALPAAAGALSWYEDDTQGLKDMGESLILSQGGTEVLERAVHGKCPDGTFIDRTLFVNDTTEW